MEPGTGLWGLLNEGESRSICEARLEYSAGILRACDPYGCTEIEVDPPIAVLPSPPILRPFTITEVVYLELERRVYVEPGMILWATAPLDIEVMKSGRPIARLASTRAKYRLVGSLVEGVIARNHRTRIWREPPEELEPCLGMVAVRISKGRDAIEGIPFNAGHATLYRDERWRIVYSRISVSIGPNIIDARTEPMPPLPGEIRPLRKPPYLTPAKSLSLGQTAVVVERGWRLWPSLRG